MNGGQCDAEQTGARAGGVDRRRRERRGAEPAGDQARSQRRLPVAFLRPNPRNPRKAFGAADLDDLTASVREKGVVQPILVRPVDGATDSYEIIAGERRWRAAQKAGLHEVPVVVRELTDKEALELAIIENVQRQDLNALEEAVGYQQLIDELRLQPERAGRGDRQEPAAHRQYAAPAQAAGRGADLSRARAS